MSQYVDIHLFGSLKETFAGELAAPIRLDLKKPKPIMDIVRNFNIEPDAVQLAMLNFRAVSMETNVKPGDRLSLFPREYPIFSDWKDLRFR